MSSAHFDNIHSRKGDENFRGICELTKKKEYF